MINRHAEAIWPVPYLIGRTKKIMAIKFHSTLFRRLIVALVTASLSSLVWAASTQRPQEIDKTYEFKDSGLQALGAAINTDISRLDDLFGTARDWNSLRAQLPRMEEKGWLGIAMKLPEEMPKAPDGGHDLQAIEIARIMPDSGAEAAGLLEGDLIVGLDGAHFKDKGFQSLLTLRLDISKKHPGDKVKLQVMRGKDLLELEATLGTAPRIDSVLKPHPELEHRQPGKSPSLLGEALEKEGLTNEFVKLLQQFHDETDKVVSPLVRQPGYNPFRLQEVNYVMNNPLDVPVVARKITDGLQRDFDQTHHDLAGLVGTAMGELDKTYVPPSPDAAQPPADMSAYVERLVLAIQHANAERTAVLSVLDTEEIDFLYSFAPTLLVPNQDADKHEPSLAEKRNKETRLLRFFHIVLKLDLPRLMNASAGIARALDLPALASLDKHSFKLEHYPASWVVHEEADLTVIDTPAGRVLIGGPQDNIYKEDATLILDLGGNDTYFNHAGGSTRQTPFSVVIDMSGDDTYSATADFSQGAGMLGGGFLVDLEGNDHYTAKNYAQGAGMLGVGMLADLAGRDQYSAISIAQGAGSFGIGLLAEAGGNDTYSANVFAQGFGFVNGFGAIVEAAGNDNYFAGGLFDDFRAPGKSYDSMSQGFGYGIRPWESFAGASGGIGVIADAEGNDTYVADYFAQGSSYWYSLGILDDRKGNDRYVSGRYSQGAGIHMSAGVLIDGEGDDNYLATTGVAQGSGHDFGIGFLLDNGGNDRYIADIIAQGAGNDNGIGVLSDNGGDDEYFIRNRGQGRGNFEPIHDLGSFGFLLDTGGSDVYSSGAVNNSLNYKTRWGILLDTN